MKSTNKTDMEHSLSVLFTTLATGKLANKELSLSDRHIGWKGFRPDLFPDAQSKAAREFLCIAKKDEKDVYTEGFLKPIGNDDFFIEVKRDGNDYTIFLHGDVSHNFSYDAIAFIQRGGHGIKQGEAFDILLGKGYSGAIFSPQLSNFSTKADTFHARYLDEVGFTTHLRTNKKGEVQANLPTDPSDERFLLSLLAMIEANWVFFLSCCRTKLVVVDSKAEAGALATAIQRGINPQLRIALVAYTLYDDLSRIPKDMILTQEEYANRLAIAGMKDYGVPDGLRFMQEKVNSVKNNKNSTIVYMSFQNTEEIVGRAKKDGVENILVIPQMSPKISFDDQSPVKPKQRIHLLRLNSSTYLQGREILSIFFKVAQQFPQDMFYLIAKEEHIPIILPDNPPSNFKYLGWIETNRSLTQYIPIATTYWIHGGNRPSVIESLHANKVGVTPIFFTQDQFTMDAAKFWGEKEFNIIKLLAIMMAVEPMIERWEMLTTIVAADKILEQLVVNPLKPDINALAQTIKNIDSIRPDVQKALSQMKIATTELFADIYQALIEGKTIPQITRDCHL